MVKVLDRMKSKKKKAAASLKSQKSATSDASVVSKPSPALAAAAASSRSAAATLSTVAPSHVPQSPQQTTKSSEFAQVVKEDVTLLVEGGARGEEAVVVSEYVTESSGSPIGRSEVGGIPVSSDGSAVAITSGSESSSSAPPDSSGSASVPDSVPGSASGPAPAPAPASGTEKTAGNVVSASRKRKEKEPLLLSHPHAYLTRTTSLAQMAREHKLAQETELNDTRKFYDVPVSAGLASTSGDPDLSNALSGHLSRGGSPSPSISRHQSYTRLDDAAMDYLAHRSSHHHHHHHQPYTGPQTHDAKEDTNLMFRTGSKIFNNSGFELGMRDDRPAWGSRHPSRHASRANSRAASRRGSQQLDLPPDSDNDAGDSDDYESILHMGRAFVPSGQQHSDSDSDASSQLDDSDLRHWSSLADSRLIRWTDKLLGLGGQDSITGLREFLREPNKAKPQTEKRRYREQSILTDPVLVLALSTLLTE